VPNRFAEEILEFGPFRLDRSRALLTRDGAEVPLRPKCFDVLRYLAEHPGRLVTKKELLAAVWQGLVVTDSSLPQCLVEVRRALGEEARELIATVPRRGYRFEAPVRVISGESSIAPATVPGRNRRFSPVAALSMVTVLLVAGLFALERNADGLEGRPAESIGPSGSAQEADGLASSVASEWVVQGQYFQGRRAPGDLQRSIEYFRQAVELDPWLAEAWVGLAGSIRLQARSGPDTGVANWRIEYKEALDRALEIDPDYPEAHIRMANFYHETGDPERAEEHFAIALRTGSDSALVHAAAAGAAYYQRDLDRAVELARRAVELEPLSAVQQWNYGIYLFYAGNPALARKHLEIALDLAPDSEEPQSTELQLAQSLVLLGEFDEARRVAEGMPEGSARDQVLALVGEAGSDLASRDRFIRKLTMRESADAALRLAELYAYIGQDDSARSWLEIALQRKTEETRGRPPSCLHEFVLEASLSPFISELPQTFESLRPSAIQVAEQITHYNCPPS
jgi:DNA-binding winged helix-turn-helix (wHTH) protein/Tfp pilus assembly protein PilF